jgi:hypothetical protein
MQSLVIVDWTNLSHQLGTKASECCAIYWYLCFKCGGALHGKHPLYLFLLHCYLRLDSQPAKHIIYQWMCVVGHGVHVKRITVITASWRKGQSYLSWYAVHVCPFLFSFEDFIICATLRGHLSSLLICLLAVHRMQGTAAGMSYLESKHVIHRDLGAS